MIPYITFREPTQDGMQYYILQKEFPHYVGIISSHPVNKTLCQIAIPGYNLWVVFCGTIRGNVIPSYNQIQNEIEIVFQNMAQWFLEHRILAEPKKFNKWKFKPSSTTS